MAWLGRLSGASLAKVDANVDLLDAFAAKATDLVSSRRTSRKERFPIIRNESRLAAAVEKGRNIALVGDDGVVAVKDNEAYPVEASRHEH